MKIYLSVYVCVLCVCVCVRVGDIFLSTSLQTVKYPLAVVWTSSQAQPKLCSWMSLTRDGPN